MSGLITKILNDSIRYTPQQKFAELTPFLEFIISDVNCNNALEIGSANGGLTYILSEIFNKVVAIDLKHEVGYEKENIIRLTVNSHDMPIERWEEIVKFSPYDLIFIDGDHTVEGVKQDYLLFKPLLSKLGVIALHDIKNGEIQNKNNCCVWKFIKESQYFEDFDSTTMYSDDTNEWGGVPTEGTHDYGGIQCWFNQPEDL